MNLICDISSIHINKVTIKNYFLSNFDKKNFSIFRKVTKFIYLTLYRQTILDSFGNFKAFLKERGKIRIRDSSRGTN